MNRTTARRGSTVLALTTAGALLLGMGAPAAQAWAADASTTATKSTLILTVDPAESTYGNTVPAFTVTADGLRLGDHLADVVKDLTFTCLSCTPNARGYLPAHQYQVKVTGTPLKSDDYTYTYASNYLTVKPRGLTIKANDVTRRTGTPTPTYTASFTGLAPGETPAGFTGLTFDGAPADAQPGTYPITPSGATDGTTNYKTTYTTGSETIIAAPTADPADPTPLTAPAMETAAPSVIYGSDATVTVRLSGTTTPTGQVVLLENGAVVAGATLSGGVATVGLSRPTAGVHELTIRYGGDSRTTAAQSAVRLIVAKVSTVLRPKATKTPGATKRGRLAVSANPTATGTMRLVLRGPNGRVVVKAEKAVRGGKATFALPRLPRGRYTYVVRYDGDVNHDAAIVKKPLRVRD